jgi:PAS domain S-box-containing protein
MIPEDALQIAHNTAMTRGNPDTELARRLAAADFVEELFDRVPEVVFFAKDAAARYVMVNRTLVERCGLRSKDDLLGRTTIELFPAPLGEHFHEQDRSVCDTGRPIIDLLELHLYPAGSEGWCLTDKVPISDDSGHVIGLAGVSRDLRMPRDEADLHELAETVAHMQKSFSEPLRVEELAAMAGLSAYRFSRRVREIFGLSPSQLIARIRVDAASDMLRHTDLRVSEIAQRCGYSDQSAFTRQFKAITSLTPSQYRAISGRG